MIEDKLKATDWEATDTAVAEQVRTLELCLAFHSYRSAPTICISCNTTLLLLHPLTSSLCRWRGKATSSGWRTRRSRGGQARAGPPRPPPPSPAARCRHAPPRAARGRDTCRRATEAPRPRGRAWGRGRGRRRRGAATARTRAATRRSPGPRAAAGPAQARPPPASTPATPPASTTAWGRASISEKLLPFLTGFHRIYLVSTIYPPIV